MAPLPRIAIATPIDGFGNRYSVTYSDDVALDANVGYSYLEGLARAGYRVEIGRCENWPAGLVLAANRAGAIITPLTHCRWCGQPITDGFPGDAETGEYHARCARERSTAGR